MIRQAISCDMCGAEKKQTNHWFVACEISGELRVSGWNSRNRLRTGSKHLCGQACLHKLADEFMARVIGEKTARTAVGEADLPPEAASDASLLSPLPVPECGIESPVRAVVTAEAIPLRPALRPAALVRMPDRSASPQFPPCSDVTPRANAAIRRKQAWQRERERSMRVSEHR